MLHNKFNERNSLSMSTIIQDMRYRQSLLGFALRHGVSKESRKYNKARSYIYFWLKRYDGSIESFACQSRRLHRHPSQHIEEEIKLLQDMCHRNPQLSRVELWCRLRKRGYQRSLGGMYRVLYKLNLHRSPLRKSTNPSRASK